MRTSAVTSIRGVSVSHQPSSPKTLHHPQEWTQPLIKGFETVDPIRSTTHIPVILYAGNVISRGNYRKTFGV